MKIMKLLVWVMCGGLSLQLASRGAESVNELFQKGLLEEEANRNLPAAVQAYEEVVKQIDSQRRLAATAIFRLGETYRKLGRTNEAVRSYDRILTEFADEPALGLLSRQNLAGLGFARTAPGATREGTTPGSAQASAAVERQRALLKQEIELVLKQQRDMQKLIDTGLAPKDSTLTIEREVLQLKRQLEALGTDPALGPRNAEVPTPTEMGEEEREIRRLTKLLEDSPDLLNVPQDGLTALQKAAQLGQVKVVEFLLKHGAGKDVPDERRVSPLLLAAANGHKAVVEALLASGLSATTRGIGGLTPLHVAAAAGHRLVVARLLESKPEIDAVSAAQATVGSLLIGEKLTPLDAAIERGQTWVVDRLIAAGADVTGANTNAHPPLEVAIRARQPALVTRLLEAGARLGAVSGRVPPLEYAVAQGEVEIVEILIRKGASITNSGSVPLLHLAIRRPDSDLRMLRLLLDAGADPNGTDPTRDGIPALSAVLEVRGFHNSAVVNTAPATPSPAELVRARAVLLLKHGAKLKTAMDYDSAAVFNAATISDDPQLAVALLAAGLNVNETLAGRRMQNDMGPLSGDSQIYPEDSLLALASRRLQSTIVEVLLKSGANPNVPDHEGLSLLSQAKNNLARLSNQTGDPNMPALPSFPRAVAPGRRLGVDGRLIANDQEPWIRRAEQVVALLIRHGAREDVVNLREIRVSRGGASHVVFLRGTNDWNRFTFFEAIASIYLRLAPPSQPGFVPLGSRLVGPLQQENPIAHPFRFPNLAEIVIRRALPNGSRKELRPDMEDVLLEWGDVIFIPEGLHVVGEAWRGLDEAVQQIVLGKIRRKVSLKIGGKSRDLDLHAGPFGAKQVLESSGLLLTTSDLERVRIVRLNPDQSTGTRTVNLKRLGSEPDLWLQAGDLVDVPDISPPQ